MDSLYISHLGMTESLGQSQVLPYLIGLARGGFEIQILSFEATGTTDDALHAVSQTLAREGIRWRPMVRSTSHHLGVKAWESTIAVARGLITALRYKPRIVHARSYLPAAAADVIASVAPGAKMLFDCRGMLGDEYIDSGNWTKDRFEYRILKRFERHAFRRTEGLVVLTDALKAWLEERKLPGKRTSIAVIPCCVDTERFTPNAGLREETRAELGLDGKLVVVYSGSLGTWYLEDEMARFLGVLKRKHGNVALLMLTSSPSDSFVAAANKEGLGDDEILVKRVPRARMPAMLAAGDLGLSFIQRCFSKLGSSPTKVAEYLACGLPVVLNDGVGDQAALRAESNACVVLPSFDDAELEKAADQAIALAASPFATRSAHTAEVARNRFSLSQFGIPKYTELYRKLCAE